MTALPWCRRRDPLCYVPEGDLPLSFHATVLFEEEEEEEEECDEMNPLKMSNTTWLLGLAALGRVLRKRCLHLVVAGDLKSRCAELSEKRRRQGVRGVGVSTSSLSSAHPA